MRTTFEIIEIKQMTVDLYGYTFFVQAMPMVVQPDNDGKWYEFQLGCTTYGVVEYLFGIKVLDHEWNDFDYNFFATYIQDYMNEYLIEE